MQQLGKRKKRKPRGECLSRGVRVGNYSCLNEIRLLYFWFTLVTVCEIAGDGGTSTV